MLGKQWLNRCTPVDMRGTIVERGQHRQRKIDGIVNWYFDHVMESLPLMLQAALLLLGCALSRFLWEINTTIASVVIAVTASGLLFYLFIVIAGAVSVNCPYQTPGANFLRHILDALGRALCILLHIQDLFRSIRDILRHTPRVFRRVLDIFRHLPQVFNTLHSAFLDVIEQSICCQALLSIRAWYEEASHSLCGIATIILRLLVIHILLLPVWFILDTCRALIWLLVGAARRVQTQLVGAVRRVQQTQLEPQSVQHAAVHTLDLRCILWTLQTSVESPVRSSALDYLATMTLDDSDPIQIVAFWFESLINFVEVTGGNAVVIQGMEQLASSSSLFCLHTLSHVAAMVPTPKVFEDVRQRYTRTFPSRTNFDSIPFSHTLGVIHSVFHSITPEGLGALTRRRTQQPIRWRVEWNGFESPSDVYITVSRALAKLARFGYQRSGRTKVPRFFLRFALHSLSQDPPLSSSVIADSLTIIAIDLECDVSNLVAVEAPDQRCVCVNQVTIILTWHQYTSGTGFRFDNRETRNPGRRL